MMVVESSSPKTTIDKENGDDATVIVPLLVASGICYDDTINKRHKRKK